MNEDARIALLQEILAGLIDRRAIAPLPDGVGDGAPLRLTLLPAATSPPRAPAATRSPAPARKPSK